MGYTASMADELVDIVDEDGRVLRQAMKSEAHRHGWLHKTVIGHFRNGDDWLLVRQAADRQDAGQLVSPMGGHVRAGEPDIAAMFREIEEELGIRNVRHKHIGTVRFHRQVIGRDENHLFINYEVWTDDEFVLGNEAVALERFTTDGFRQAFAQTPEEFGDSLYFAVEHLYPFLLPKGYTYRWNV